MRSIQQIGMSPGRRDRNLLRSPIEKRERNQAGKPGKLHAKVALIDDAVLISSANLTDDAFNRNLEIGVKLTGGSYPKIIREYFEGLCTGGVLAPVAPAEKRIFGRTRLDY